ncbi:MAG: group II intron reverse transcriptase/maturase [Sulfobacillus acidophilus]|uniref:Group II intron reverse transcriptase/maturase n=1 Tax=Sulfobacillus acidophilus TaxID=53633 RepID=A0A2T2WDJ1_9FIRM|nr:MAG: group II intron reverse transcriptase/maturase [Sulfobacillus acidophilus]
MKWYNLYGQLLSYQRLYAAWLKVEANRGAGGVDGVSVSAFSDRLEENLRLLLHQLQTKTYRPLPVLRRYIPKPNGKQRPLGLPAIRDKIVQQAVVDILQPLYETVFHPASVGFRPNKGAFNAFGRIIHWMEQGYIWVYDADIQGYFEAIDHRLLMRLLQQRIADRSILDLVWQWLKAGVVENGVRSVAKSGSPQGGVISPLLANIYLNELDWELEQAGVPFVRYADDFLVFAKDAEGAQRGSALVEAVMHRLKLTLAPEKTQTVHLKEQLGPEGRTIPELEYLGVVIQGWFRKRDGTWSYGLKCSASALKAFRAAIKEETPKTHTLSLQALIARVNPVILGKAAYWAQAAKAVQTYRTIRGHCHCATALIRQQATQLDAYVRQRLRRVRLPQRGGTKTYRRAAMLHSVYTHERLIGAGLRYAERVVQDAAMGLPLTDAEYLALVQQRRAQDAARKRRSKAGDRTYWDRRAAAAARARQRVLLFEST